MKWQGRQKSTNVSDRRGGRGGATRKMAKRGGGLGIGAIIIIVIAQLVFGVDVSQLVQGFQGAETMTVEQPATTPGEGGIAGQSGDDLGDFVKVVLKDTEDVWNKLFAENGMQYREPILVLFEGSVTSACGHASAATGPFYCPADEQLYIDLSFYRELKERFKAPGDFAMAYVVAHEVAHHVQNLLGITRQVQSQRGRISKTEYNKLNVKLELQADFLSGVWAHHAHKMKDILEEGDIEEALNAAHAIGDDRLQMEARGYVVPESFTHGTSEQRMRCFTRGLKSGRIQDGDTFSGVCL